MREERECLRKGCLKREANEESESGGTEETQKEMREQGDRE